ncbi:hypothetical protein [Streptomyces filamentosus]|uniref:hypothetical protein n=1 Tax=Streptomyces filamentosus TaxID=67294 RepID=UPI0037D29E4B
MGEEPNDARPRPDETAPQDTPPQSTSPQDAPPPRIDLGKQPADAPDDAVRSEGTMVMRPLGAATPPSDTPPVPPAPPASPVGTPPDAGTGSAPAGSFGPPDPSVTGSFRLPPPAPAGGPAPWEAPQGQNGGSAGPGGGTPGFGAPQGPYAGGPGGFGGQAPAASPGWAGAGTLPPPPPAPPAYGPGGGHEPGRGEARPLQAALVAVLNLSCLGLGYLLLRHWVSAALCWAATAGLLVAALPADADGVPQGVLLGYGAFLLLAAADGARRGLRARLSFGTAVRRLALPLAVVLLAVPAGGAVAYASAHADAREEARQQALLARLAAADELVAAHKGEAYATAQADYLKALEEYGAIGTKDAGSRAGKLVPARLDAYYEQVSAPYGKKSYCEALDPLKHLHTLPTLVDKGLLGDRPAGVAEPLAHSTYECGAAALGRSAEPKADGYFSELAADFPQSPYTAKVVPAVRDAVRARVGALTAAGEDRCTATEELRTLRSTAGSVEPLEQELEPVRTEADQGVRKGVFACGTQQFGKKQFAKAAETMDAYAKDYPDDARTPYARSVSIAARVAEEEPEAGKRLPPEEAPGGARMTLVISNDAPSPVDVLYTGPLTGTFTLKACGGCRKYERVATLRPGFKACAGASSKYPKVTLDLPAGTYHMLQQRLGTSALSTDQKVIRTKIEPGYTYTTCLYTSSLL